MNSKKNFRVSFFLGYLTGTVLTVLFLTIITYLYIMAIQGTRVTNIQNYYMNCQKFFEKNKRSPETEDEFVEFVKKEYPASLAFWKPLENGTIKYYRLSDETWLILALDGAPGFVLTERVKVGQSFHQRWVRRCPLKIEDVPETILPAE